MSKKFQIIAADCPWSFKDRLTMSDVARGALANYNTLTISQIKQLPIQQYADPNGCVLALWVPSSLLQEGLDVMKAWGFVHKQTYVWVKIKNDPVKELRDIFFNFMKTGSNTLSQLTNKKFNDYIKNSITIADTLDLKKGAKFIQNTLGFGMGQLFRQAHEICLIGINNTNIYKNLSDKAQRSVCFAHNLKHSAKPETLQDSLELMFPKAEKLELFARRLRANWICLGNEVCNGEDITVSLSKL